MKKTVLTFQVSLIFFSANAQKSINSFNQANAPITIEAFPNSNGRALGDTLLYMPLVNIIVNPFDLPLFGLDMEDLDGQITSNPGIDMDFGIYYSTDSSTNVFSLPTQNNFYHPWETPFSSGTDSAFYFGASSWFIPLGVADNWLEFGPITIPLTGATLQWYDRTKAYRDGYEVLLSTSGMYNYLDFTSPAIYSKIDASPPSPTATTDTTWQFRSAPIPASYLGTSIYFAFHHIANDMDMLFLDEITVIEGGPTCDANFITIQDTANLYDYTIYNSSSSGPTYSYLWDFGDSTTSTLQYPTHVYSWSGPFQICLTVSDAIGCSDMKCDSITPGHSPSNITTLTVLPPATVGIQTIEKKSSFKIYPNPFNSSATVNYSINEECFVELVVFDLLGNEISSIEVGNKLQGNHSYIWNAENMSKGMYLLQLKTGNTISTQKVIITK